MKHPRTWYVVADGGRARIVQKREDEDAFDTRLELVSTEIHSHTQELGTDRPGRTHESAMSARHAIQPREDLHRASKRHFVHEVAATLVQANSRNEFDCLVLVAPAHVLGELRHALDAPTQRKLVAQLQKDLTKVPDANLKEHLAGLDRA